MKFRKFGRTVLATAVSLTLGLGLSACGGGSSDFLYVTTSTHNPGEVAVYRVDRQSGKLSALQSPIYAAGRNPVAETVSADGKNLYVVNHDDNTIIQYAIGTDGKLYPQHTYNTPGTFPTAVAINTASTFLYVVDNYQPGSTDSIPGLGAVVVYPIATSGALGTPLVNTSVSPNISFFPVGLNPSGVAVLPAGTSIYVVNKGVNSSIAGDAAFCPATAPLCAASISAFSIDSSGALSPIAGGSGCNGALCAGSAPSGIAVHPNGSYVYVTDSAANQLIAYSVGTAANAGALTKVDTEALGNGPAGITADANGDFLYVANYGDNRISTYAISTSVGATTAGIPKAVGVSSATGTGPTCVIVEPSVERYVYTSNFLDSTISGFQLNPSSGALTPIQNSPYPLPGGAGQPTCVAVIRHGKRTAQGAG